MPDSLLLSPTDPDQKALVDKWMKSGEIYEVTDWNSISNRIGNLLTPLTLPMMVANVIHNFTVWNFLESISMIPLVSNRSFISMAFMFKIYGVEIFVKNEKFTSLLSLARKGLNHHFSLLTKDLEASGGPYICGSKYTIADVGMIPIFERMEYARWWTNSLKSKYPLVVKYWEEIQKREGYVTSRCDVNLRNKFVNIGKIIDQWKHEFKWFNDFYEN